MLSAVLVTVLGLTASIALMQLTGLRLSGVVVVSLVALATLVAVSVHPVFLGSVAVAIAAVGLSSQRTSIHRRALVLASLAADAIVPVAGTLAMSGLSLPVTGLNVPTELEPLTAMAPGSSADARGVE
ncbi:capsule biosynthesis CapC-like protein [Natrinema hispanicum]|uniref:Capsule biosynthesis CapC-like protein n=1 Tax=Natrinema hispanicum TaxID=392421 RepID=A0A482Y7W4_9EURY|nr:capsule biosynthesis CapC-like protein [Natrinema hispanicum]